MMRYIVVLVMALSICLRADAQALPAFRGLVNKALGQTIEKTAIRRGFAANDPRMAATYAGAATVVASIAADVAIAAATAATAPVWLSVAAGVGAAAVVGGLAYGAYKIFFDDATSEAKFVVKTVGGMGTPGTPWIPAGNDVYKMPGLTFDTAQHVTNSTKDRVPNGVLNFFGIQVFGDDPAAMMQLAVRAWIDLGGGTGAKFKGCDPETTIDTDGASTVTCHAIRIGSGGNTQPESSWLASNHTFFMVANIWKTSTTYKGTIAKIVAQLPAAELAKPADATTIAILANNLWQATAAKPGYQGIPYSVTYPVTVADAQAVQDANPTTWPTNADLVSPVAPGAGQEVNINPEYNPGTSPNPNPVPTGTANVNVVNTPNVNVANPVKIDWGANPNVESPSLEATPTASMILSPLVNLMPSLRNFVVPSHSSVCPTPTFNLFNTVIVMDAQCSVLDGVRPTLAAAMAFVWLMLGTFIVLRA